MTSTTWHSPFISSCLTGCKRQCRSVYSLSCMDHPKKVGSSQEPQSRHLPNSCRTAYCGGGGWSELMPWNSSAHLWRRWTWMSLFCLLKGLVLCSWPEALCLARNVPFSTAGANGEPCGWITHIVHSVKRSLLKDFPESKDQLLWEKPQNFSPFNIMVSFYHRREPSGRKKCLFECIKKGPAEPGRKLSSEAQFTHKVRSLCNYSIFISPLNVLQKKWHEMIAESQTSWWRKRI